MAVSFNWIILTLDLKLKKFDKRVYNLIRLL